MTGSSLNVCKFGLRALFNPLGRRKIRCPDWAENLNNSCPDIT
jgi:hypothetical protein